MTVTVYIDKFEPSVTYVADEHPVVNDKDYCEVITLPPSLHFSCDGIKCMTTGRKNQTKEELMEKIPSIVAWEEWFEKNWMKSFSDVGMEDPLVYDYEEDAHYHVSSIDNYVNNCYDEDDYKTVVAQLKSIAEKEIKVVIIDE